MRKPRVTINEVAAKARVHASTVSRVLNEETRSMVSKPVADRVLGVARKLGYLPNPMAAGLRTRRSRTIGVLIPDLTNPVFPPIVRGITQTLHDAGYVVVLADSNNDVREAQAIVANLRARHVDGLILATAQREDPVVEDCVEHGTPLVLVNRSADKTPVATVATDDDLGIHLALEHLLELGHRRIAFVGGPQSTSTGYVRYRAFLAAIKERGLEIDRAMIVNGKAFSEPAGKESLAKIIETEGVSFTAVVAANDLLALGCFDALEEHGLRCPHDVSVTGFNHMPFVDRFTPSLTTVHIPHRELGVKSAELLLERIANPAIQPRTIRLRPHLVVGRSTRALGTREQPGDEAPAGTVARIARAAR
jgi:LacI family transcriptional regulator, galactose operon repressor